MSDCPSQELAIIEGGRTHTVSVYASEFCQEHSEVHRFETIWAELLTLIPSPNRSQGDRPSIWLESLHK
jgi:hypothetical protein